MKQILKTLLLSIILFTGKAVFSQQLPVRLNPPPVYQFFTEDMFKLTITNTSQVTYRIYLHGRATENTKGMIVEASSSSFVLPPGTKQVKPSDVGKITINEKNETYKNVITQMGQLPTGNYEICIEVINEATNQLLGSDCIQHEVLQVSQLMLISPENKSGIKKDIVIDTEPSKSKIKKDIVIDDTRKYKSLSDSGKEEWDRDLDIVNNTGSSILLFSWLPPVPVPRGYSITYKIKIAEMIGMQSAYDAMQSNPLFYSQNNIITTSYLYPIAARSFSVGRKYAWQVQAYVNGVLLSESEVWSFQYGQNTASYKPPPLKRPWWLNVLLKDNIEISSASENQKKQNPFMFSFSSTMYGESSNRSGTGSDKEPRNGYLELTPSLLLYNIPFSTSILFSSENSSNRQNINTAGMNLDVSTIKDAITERIEKEKDKILEEGKKEVSNLSQKEIEKLESDAKSKVMSRINPVLKFMSYFNTLGIGTTYPSYTPLTVQGVPVTGANFEFNPGWFYIAVAGAKNQKAIDNSSFRRYLYSGRLGYGQKEKSHIYLTGMYTNDDANSIKVDSSNYSLTPNSNYLFGIEGKLNLLKEKLTIEAEAVGSMLTRDNRDADLENKSIPTFVKNLFHPKISSQIDYSYTLKTTFNNEQSNTKVVLGLKMIGPGFITLGNPTLRGDKLEVETKLDQKFMNKQISLKASLKWFRDNLIQSRSATTTYVIPMLSVNFSFKKYPYVMFSYMPMFMSNDATDPSIKYEYKSHLLMLNTGHNLVIGKSFLTSNITYTLNTASSLDTAAGYTSHGLTLYESFSFDFPLTLSSSFGAQFYDYVNDYSRILSFDVNISYIHNEVWTNTIGTATSVERDKNKKLNLYISSIFDVIKGVSLDLRAERNLYTDWFNGSNNYDEFILRGTFITQF